MGYNITARFADEKEKLQMKKFIESGPVIDILEKYKNSIPSSIRRDLSGGLFLSDKILKRSDCSKEIEEMAAECLSIKETSIYDFEYALFCWIAFKSQFRVNNRPVVWYDEDMLPIVDGSEDSSVGINAPEGVYPGLWHGVGGKMSSFIKLFTFLTGRKSTKELISNMCEELDILWEQDNKD